MNTRIAAILISVVALGLGVLVWFDANYSDFEPFGLSQFSYIPQLDATVLVNEIEKDGFVCDKPHSEKSLAEDESESTYTIVCELVSDETKFMLSLHGVMDAKIAKLSISIDGKDAQKFQTLSNLDMYFDNVIPDRWSWITKHIAKEAKTRIGNTELRSYTGDNFNSIVVKEVDPLFFE